MYIIEFLFKSKCITPLSYGCEFKATKVRRSALQPSFYSLVGSTFKRKKKSLCHLENIKSPDELRPKLQRSAKVQPNRLCLIGRGSNGKFVNFYFEVIEPIPNSTISETSISSTILSRFFLNRSIKLSLLIFPVFTRINFKGLFSINFDS